jgi:hypothetical protein
MVTSLEFFVVGFLVGVVSTLVLCATARKRGRIEPPVEKAAVATEQLGSATTNAPDELARLGHESGAEIFDD